jgi:hypothetical protein
MFAADDRILPQDIRKLQIMTRSGSNSDSGRCSGSEMRSRFDTDRRRAAELC